MEAKRRIVITRIFDAPRELVFKVWADLKHIARWWGPKDFTAPFCSVDLRAGGEYFYCMRSSEGKDYWSKGVFKEVIPPEKIVYTDSFADAQGNTVPAS